MMDEYPAAWQGFGKVAPSPDVWIDTDEIRYFQELLASMMPYHSYTFILDPNSSRFGTVLVTEYHEAPDGSRGGVKRRKRYTFPTFDTAGAPILTLDALLSRFVNLEMNKK